VYHLELRKFPKRVHRFNMSGPEIGAVLLEWVQERVLELGEQKWRPEETDITVLEGPEVPPREISMARGWRRAEREGRDVTEQVLAEAREHVRGGDAPARAAAERAVAEPGARVAASVIGGGAEPSVGSEAASVVGGGADSMALVLQLGSLLGQDAARLMDAWRAVRVREPDLAPSEALAAAERELRGE
jgi:hypothetical protein